MPLCKKLPLQLYFTTYCKPSPKEFLMHYGVKGMKWGVRRTPEELGHGTKSSVEKSEKTAIIKTTVTGHESIPKQSTPNSILDHVNSDGKVDSRSYYGPDGMKIKDIHTTDHGNPKHHQIVPHAHDYDWKTNGERPQREPRELTDIERKENKDIL